MSLLRSFVRELTNTAEGLKKDLALQLKDVSGINLNDGLPLEFGLTGAIPISAELKGKFSHNDLVLYSLWERFERFEEALKIIKTSLTSLGDKIVKAEDTKRKLTSLQIVVSNICQTIKQKYLVKSGVRVEEKPFSSLAQNLINLTVAYIKVEKENMKDSVDSGKEEILVENIRNYVIVSEIISMALVFQIAISKISELKTA